MKLRLSSSNIRIRLEADEVLELESGEEVVLAFPLVPEQLTIRLLTAVEGPMIHAQRGEWQIVLPTSWVHGWMASDRVGFDTEVKAVDGGSMRLVVEKNFPCRHDASGAPPIPSPDRMDASERGADTPSSSSVL